MNIQDIRSMIDNTHGKIFSVIFTKKDGSLREMVCRIDVTKHLKGGENMQAHIDSLYTVFDMQAKGYRNINLSTVKQMKVDSKLYSF